MVVEGKAVSLYDTSAFSADAIQQLLVMCNLPRQGLMLCL